MQKGTDSLREEALKVIEEVDRLEEIVKLGEKIGMARDELSAAVG